MQKPKNRKNSRARKEHYEVHNVQLLNSHFLVADKNTPKLEKNIWHRILSGKFDFRLANVWKQAIVSY